MHTSSRVVIFALGLFYTDADSGSSPSLLLGLDMTEIHKCNANAKISYLRCKKITNAINKSLLPFIEDDTNFKDCTHDLLSTEFARKSKDLVNKVKAMWSSLSSWREQKPFFWRAFSHKRWESGGAMPKIWSRWRPPIWDQILHWIKLLAWVFTQFQ